jgi:D-amino-acid dehydrogenase
MHGAAHPGSVAVVGAGIVGICAAVALRSRGLDVTLLDRGGPGEGCSFGNAGMIQTGSSLPIAVPGLLGKLPGMLLDPEGPLSLKWRHLPRFLPWGVHFARNASAARAQSSEALLAVLLARARDAWETLAGNTAAADVFRARGELYVVRSEAAFAGYAAKIEALKRNGIAYEVLDTAGIRRMEPQLAPAYRYGLYLPESAYVASSLLLSQRMLENFLRAGGRFERGDVSRISRAGTGARLQLADGREIAATRVVVAAGAASARMAAWLGLRLPVEPLRGYHIVLPHLETPLAGPVIEGEMNIAITPMLDGNRVAGTIEFAGHDAPPTWRRADMLAPMAKRMVPALAGEAASRWHGDRPGTPDSLPILGPANGDEAVWFACGHGTLGLTLAARTGLMLAAALTGEPGARAAILPFLPDRFGGRSIRANRKEQA